MESRTVCSRCRGRGYRMGGKEAPVIKDRGKKAKPRFVTEALGSGCPKCKGLGHV